MVSATRGVFISCDAAMAEFIVRLNESMPESDRFVVDRLDDTHMYVLSHAVSIIRREIAEFSKRNNCSSNLLRPKRQSKMATTVKSNFLQDA